MAIKRIIDLVGNLKRKYPDQDIYTVIKNEGIDLLLTDMGSESKACKGFILQVRKSKCITLNNEADKVLLPVIAAHELGHAKLHMDGENYFFPEKEIFGRVGRTEAEANYFAAEFLLDDAEILDDFKQYSFSQTAAIHNVPQELLSYKIKLLIRKGYDLRESPIVEKNDFLKDL